MVMPTPTAEPFRAAMTGLRQRWIATVTLPPLPGRNRISVRESLVKVIGKSVLIANSEDETI